MHNAVRAVLVALLVAPVFGVGGQQGPTNLGFETRDSSGSPAGWRISGTGFQLGMDSVSPFAGAVSLRSRWSDSSSWTMGGGRTGRATRDFPVATARGRMLHFSGYIRTEQVRTGYAGLWVRVDAGPKVIAYDYMPQRGPRQTTPWTRYDIEVPVDSGATRIEFGVLHQGNGAAWFDSLSIDVVGPALPRTVADLGPTNLGFEARDSSGQLTQWNLNGTGYQLTADSVAPLAGRFSLRSRWTDSVPWQDRLKTAGRGSLHYPLALALGRTLHLSGYIRTEHVTAGYAGLRLYVFRDNDTLAFDNMAQRGARQTTSWTRYDIELPVDSGATEVMFGVVHNGTGTAWFDSLTIAVVGPELPRTVADVAPFKPEPRPAEDLTRLLSDAELAPPPDSVPPPAENREWTRWVKAHAHAVRSLGAADFSDLKFFEPLLLGKRIVQLGESGHGVAEFDMAKVRLIKYLHEKLGYDVIAFESSLFECDRAQRAAASLSAEQLMRNCIFGVWHTSETLPLFEYIKQTQATSHPLVLAGFDEQPSTPSASTRPAFFRDVVARVDTAYALVVETKDRDYSALMTRSFRPVLKRDRETIVAFYDSLATWLRSHERAGVAAMPGDAKAPLVARQTAMSMAAFTRQLVADGDSSLQGTNIRDRAMADNLDFLLNEMYPAKKVMVWAHNFHVQNREGPRDSADRDDPKTMGAWTAERHRAELYTIGLFMYRGSAAKNDRTAYAVERMPGGSLESILHRAPWRYAYVDLSKARRTPGTSWMFSRIPTMSWGDSPDPMTPRSEFDGILFIDTTHPPHYVSGQPRLP